MPQQDALKEAAERAQLRAVQARQQAIDERRARVRAMLDAGPQKVAFVTKQYRDKMLVTFAVRGLGIGDLLIESDRWNPEGFLRLVESAAKELVIAPAEGPA